MHAVRGLMLARMQELALLAVCTVLPASSELAIRDQFVIVIAFVFVFVDLFVFVFGDVFVFVLVFVFVVFVVVFDDLFVGTGIEDNTWCSLAETHAWSLFHVWH